MEKSKEKRKIGADVRSVIVIVIGVLTKKAMLYDQTTGNERKETAKGEKRPGAWVMTRNESGSNTHIQKPCSFLSLKVSARVSHATSRR